MISFFEFGISCCITVFGMLCARLFWPCAENLQWSTFIIIFLVCIVFTLLSHMSSWKCWSYLCRHRRRLHSLHNVKHSTPYVTMSVIIVFELCLFYGLVVYFYSCDLQWWPALVIFACYTAVATSASLSLSLSSSSNVNLHSSCGTSGSAFESEYSSSCESNGISSSEDSS